MKQIRVFQIGCGKMSKYIMNYIYNLEGTIVGAVDLDTNKIGKDISEIMESDKKGIKIEDVKKLDELLKLTKPDIAVITTMSYLNDIEEELRTCITNGVNVITTAEECFYAQSSNPTLFKEIDILAKSYHVTVTGCGYQDIFWGSLITTIAASTHNITKIKGSSSYNVEDYGIALAKAHGAGLTPEEFDKTIASTNNMSEEEREKLMKEKSFFPSYMWNVAGWLADRLGIHIVSMKQECFPVLCEHELQSKTLNMTLDNGMVRGMNAVVTATTKENILLEIECIGKVYAKDEEDENAWTIYGEPDARVVITEPKTVELTCASIVNIIPDLLKSEAGFVPTSKMGELKYNS